MTELSVRMMELSVAPLDAARSVLLRALGRRGRRFLVDRELRVGLYGSLAMISALLLTIFKPFLLLAVGPVLFGAPHLVSDIRYLVARQGLHRRRGFWLLVAAPLTLTLAVPHATSAFPSLFGATLLARGNHARRSLVIGTAFALVLLAAAAGPAADVLFAQAHNGVAIVLWWRWAPCRGGARWVPLALFALASASLLGGAFDGMAQLGPKESHLGLSLQDLISTLAPSSHGMWGLRLVLFFAFAQSVHYAVWLRLIPEEDRTRPGLRPFVSSLRALRADLGAPLVASAILAAVAFPLWATVDVLAARMTYLRFALFHGPMEIAIASLLFIERGQLKVG